MALTAEQLEKADRKRREAGRPVNTAPPPPAPVESYVYGDFRGAASGDVPVWNGVRWVSGASSGGGGGGGNVVLALASSPRPAASTYPVGAALYDPTLHEPIYSDGTTWRDGRGQDVDIPPPGAPTLLGARGAQSGKLTVTWTAPSGSVASYTVKRGTVSGGPYTVIGTGITATSYVDSGLTNGTTYYYVVQAVGPGGVSADSAEVSGVPSAADQTVPYDAASDWNQLIGGSPTLHTNSAAIVARVVAGGAVPPVPNALTGDPDQFTIPVTVIDPTTTPLVPVNLSGGYHTFDAGDTTSVGHGFPAGAQQFPIPNNVSLAAGSDSQQIFLDPVNGLEYGLWQLTGGPGNWSATNGFRSHYISPDGNGYHYSGWFFDQTAGRGGGSSYLAGLVRRWEIAAGVISHALAWGFNSPLGYGAASGGLPLPPAPKSDGGGSNIDDPPEGVLFQLDPTLNLTTELTPTGLGATADAFQRVVAKALQDYGMYLIDHAGSTKVYVELRGTAGWDASITRAAVSGIPLNRFRAIAPKNMAAPSAPTGVTATPGNNQVTLNWSAVADVNTYRYDILRSTTSGSGYTKIGQTKGIPGGGASGSPRPALSFVDGAVSDGTAYFYVVQAVNAAAASANSSQVSATPILAAPTAPTGLVASPGSTQVVLTWNPVSSATSYTVKRSTTSGSGYTNVGTGLSSPTFTDTGRTNGTTYYYVVSATNAVGESPNSSEVSATPQSKLFRAQIAQASQNSSQLTLVAPVLVASQAGDTIVVGVVGNNVSTTFDSVTDSKGNVYTAGSIVSGGNQGGRTQLFVALGPTGGSGGGATAALTTSDTITVTSGNARQVALEAFAASGVTARDVASTGSSGATSGTAVDSGSTAAAGQVDIEVGVIGTASPLDTVTPGTGWTTIGSGLIAGNLKGLYMAYRIPSSAEAAHFTATLSQVDGWHAIVEGLR